MSTELGNIKAKRGRLALKQFCGGNGTAMLQVTQGFSKTPDSPGFLQLTPLEAFHLSQALIEWVKKDCQRKADKLEKKIAKDQSLQQTIFSDIHKCNSFVQNFQPVALAVELYENLTDL